MKLLRRNGLLLCLWMVLLTLTLTGTFCWSSVSQTARNEARDEPKAQVELHKFERAPDGTPTTIPLPGADFLLYCSDGTPLGGTYTTDALGKITLELPAGDYWFEEWNPAPGYGFDLDAAGAPIRKYPFTVSGADVAGGGPVIVSVYNSLLTGSLTVTKTVENPDGSPLAPEQKEQEFTFTVTFSDGGAYDYILFDADGTEKGTYAFPADGRIRLKHGQRAVFTGIPTGVTYTVTETPVDEYDQRSFGHTGHITVAGATAEFRNINQRGSLEITKSVVNEDGQTPTTEQLAQEFTFTVTFSDGGTYPYTVLDGSGNALGGATLLSGQSLPLKHGLRALFTGLPDGVRYTVTETPIPAGCRPVHTSFAGEIVGGFTARADFENRFGEEPNAPGGMVVEKAIQNPGGAEPTEEQKALEFEFTVTFTDGAAHPYIVRDADGNELSSGSIPGSGAVKLRHGWRLVFPALPAGLGYTVVETGTNDYRALPLSADGTVRGGMTAELLFRNIPPEPETGTLILTKTVVGARPAADAEKEFVFTVTFSDAESHSYTIYDAAGVVQGTGTIAGNGSLALRHGWRAVFPGLPRGMTYTITERDYSADGYTLTMTGGAGTVTGGEITAEAVNTYPRTLIAGLKLWDLGDNAGVTLPSSVWIRLYQGTTFLGRVQAAPDPYGNWAFSFTAPKYDVDGNEIVYRVEEEPVANFTPAYDAESFNIINHYDPPVKSTPPPNHPGPDPTPTPPPTPTKMPTHSVPPTPSGETSPTHSATPTPSREPSPTHSAPPTPSGEPSPTPSVTSTSSAEPTPTPSVTPTPSEASTPTHSVTPTSSETSSPTPSQAPPPSLGKTPPPTPDIPKTGDERMPALWITLAVVSTVGISCCAWYAKKHRYCGKRVLR